ncbi:hypothetical protein G6F58_013232 [Rhizopus delemar]|nr:hypothetical protein G6F58_013232 [Rhizopus delemar]
MNLSAAVIGCIAWRSPFDGSGDGYPEGGERLFRTGDGLDADCGGDVGAGYWHRAPVARPKPQPADRRSRAGLAANGRCGLGGAAGARRAGKIRGRHARSRFVWQTLERRPAGRSLAGG